MNDKTLTVTVVGRRCVYINDYRVAGSKPYVSENLPSWSFEADINDLRYAIGRRPSSANKALQARVKVLEEALTQIKAQDKKDEGSWSFNYATEVERWYPKIVLGPFGKIAEAALQETGQ